MKALMFHVFVNKRNFCFLYLPVFGPMQLPSHLVTTTMWFCSLHLHCTFALSLQTSCTTLSWSLLLPIILAFCPLIDSFCAYFVTLCLCNFTFILSNIVSQYWSVMNFALKYHFCSYTHAWLKMFLSSTFTTTTKSSVRVKMIYLFIFCKTKLFALSMCLFWDCRNVWSYCAFIQSCIFNWKVY